MSTRRVELDVGMWDLQECKSLSDVRALLNRIEASVPEQFRADIKWEVVDCEEGVWLNVFYECPETKEERQARYWKELEELEQKLKAQK